jgi:hypothetical protein
MRDEQCAVIDGDFHLVLTKNPARGRYDARLTKQSLLHPDEQVIAECETELDNGIELEAVLILAQIVFDMLRSYHHEGEASEFLEGVTIQRIEESPMRKRR